MLYYVHFLAYGLSQLFIASVIMAVYLAVYWLVLLWPNNGALNFLMFVGAFVIIMFLPETLDRWGWGKPDISAYEQNKGCKNDYRV